MPGSEEDSPYPETATLLAELVEILVGYLGGEVQEATVPEPESTEPDTPIPASPEVEVRKPAESKRDIDTEALIEAALATEPLPQPATGEPAAVAEVTEDTGVTPVVPKEADEGELTPETALEPEPEPEPVPEQPQAGEEEDTEEASSPEPDPLRRLGLSSEKREEEPDPPQKLLLRRIHELVAGFAEGPDPTQGHVQPRTQRESRHCFVRAAHRRDVPVGPVRPLCTGALTERAV